jgi:tetratricopeptide (TPR) repeat protein
LGALQRAEQLAGQDERALDPSLRERLQALRVRLDADETDRRFVATFDEILVQVIVWDARRSQSKSEDAFLALKGKFKSCYGLQFGITPAAEVAISLQKRPQPIQSHLLAALHICLARVPLDDPQAKRWLVNVLEVADGDAWRTQAREALTRNNWPSLEKLLKEVTLTQQPPALVLVLSSYLPDDSWTTKHDLVLQIQQKSPGEPGTSRFANALTCDILAWKFTDTESGNEKRAVDLANQAVRLAPYDGDFWNTLGVAHYRAGNWKEAVTALEKAKELSGGGDAVDWLFLAMAHWQLGQKDEARLWYDQAVRRLETSKLLEAELPRFRTEAANLLGINQ